MPYDLYNDPELTSQLQNDAGDQVVFEQVGDRVRGRVLSVEKITTRFGPTLKYMLFTDKGEQKSLLGGGKNLFAQLMEKAPQRGDTLVVRLIELRNVAQGTAKIFDVSVERGDAAQLAPPRASAPAVDPFEQANADDGEDLFDR
jgi:hypothetical protein